VKSSLVFIMDKTHAHMQGRNPIYKIYTLVQTIVKRVFIHKLKILQVLPKLNSDL